MTRARRLAAGVVVLAAALAAGIPVAAAPAQGRVQVFFLRGEQLAAVSRPGSTAEDAIRALVAGPTRAERARGFSTNVPRATRVLSVTAAGGIATVNLGGRFTAGGDTGSLLARLSQVVRTASGPEGAPRVQLLINGRIAPGRFPGIPTSRPLTYRFLQTPNGPVPEPPGLKLPPPDPGVKTLQDSLIELGYMVRGDDDGRFGPATSNAILALQKWEGLRRTGVMDDVTDQRLVTAQRPLPVTRGPAGKRAEVLLDRQVALLINNNTVVRTIAVSTGKPGYETPPGSYKVYAKIPRWWSVPFREWLPLAIPFVGGYAFHEFQVVPPYPASHGCVRQLYTVARWTYNFATVGMPVRVLAKS
jgi:hypothetical protein